MDPPGPVFKKKTRNKKKNKADGKKIKKCSNDDGGHGSGASVVPIFSA